jgi:hypothetical protein
MKLTIHENQKAILSLSKSITLLCLFLVSQITLAGEIFSYTLSKSEKIEGTYTAHLSANGTMHFAIIKNTESKDFLLTPFYVDQSRNVKRLEAFASKEMFAILSYHESNGVVSVVNYDADNKQVQFIDYNLGTGKVTSSAKEMKEAPDNVFRLTDRTLLVSFNQKKNTVDLDLVTDSGHIASSQITISKDKQELFRTLISMTPDAINQQEFVEKGSILSRKGYFIGDNLVYTMGKGREQLQVFRFDLKQKTDFTHSIIETGFTKESKDVSNYFYDDKLVFLSVGKQDLSLKTFDAHTSKVIRQLSILNDLQKILPENAVADYVKTALKSTIKSTVTVNKTKTGKLAFRLDNVEEAQYHYHYNWFMTHWMFQQQMMMQQQMMQHQVNSARGFGPSPEAYLPLVKEKKLPSIEFVLDVDFNVNQADSDAPVYPNIDKDKYLDIYKDNKTMKNLTSDFTETDMRYISFNPKTKTISIAFDTL